MRSLLSVSPMVGNVPLGKTGMEERVVVGGGGSEPRIWQGPVGRDWEEEMGGVRRVGTDRHRAGGKKGGRAAGHGEVNRTALPPLPAGPRGRMRPATDFPFPKVPWNGEGLP